MDPIQDNQNLIAVDGDPLPIWRVSFIGFIGEPAVVAEGPEATVREAVHPFLETRMREGFSLADLVPWLDWELIAPAAKLSCAN